MTLATEPTIGHLRHMLLEDVSWEEYERMLREAEAEHRHLRITYDDGRMEIVSPSGKHERVKGFIGMLIEQYGLERDIWFLPLGSVTCRRKNLRCGLEPDECYYVQHRPANADELDLNVEPPPDLAVEVDITRSSLNRDSIYARLGVPEVWRFTGDRVEVLVRTSNGGYIPATRSAAFPDLDIDALNRFLTMGLEGDQHAAAMAFRKWLRETDD